MARPVLTLTTDFGLQDYFVGAMKGVIKSIAPDAEIIDISHDIPPHRISEGAFLLEQTWRCFPKKTVHVVVVDPGVGSARRPILVQAGGQYFVGPDNGVLSPALAVEKAAVRHITAERYFRQPVSTTFHGRDIFAPVGAHLAAGVSPARFGPKIIDAFRPAFEGVTRTGKRTWVGEVRKIDRFGNLITSIPAADFPDLAQRVFELRVGMEVCMRMVSNYESAAPGELVVIAGSAGLLEISLNQKSAAAELKVGPGAPVELSVW